MAKKAPSIALYYVPTEPGAGFTGVPRRDLTERDIAKLGGEQLANITSPHPNGAPAIYQPSKPTGKRAEIAATVKEQSPAVTDGKE